MGFRKAAEHRGQNDKEEVGVENEKKRDQWNLGDIEKQGLAASPCIGN